MSEAPPLPWCSYLRLACSSLGAPAPRGLGPLHHVVFYDIGAQAGSTDR
jgi:hypothetical protein